MSKKLCSNILKTLIINEQKNYRFFSPQINKMVQMYNLLKLQTSSQEIKKDEKDEREVKG
jgi:hypothetical protein